MQRQYIIILPLLNKYHPGDQNEIRINLEVFVKVELGTHNTCDGEESSTTSSCAETPILT